MNREERTPSRCPSGKFAKIYKVYFAFFAAFAVNLLDFAQLHSRGRPPARAPGNNCLVEYIHQLVDDMERTLVHDPYLTDPNQHKRIVEALLSKDKKQAQEAMYLHIEETRNRIVNRF